MKMNKNTRKFFKLQTREKYKSEKIGQVGFIVYTQDLKFKATICDLGIQYFAKEDIYNKIDFYKLRNYCELFQKLHYGY